MIKHWRLTHFAVVLNVAGIVLFFSDLGSLSLLAFVAAYFATAKDVVTYTGWYQFAVVYASAFFTGAVLDSANGYKPFMTASFLLATSCSMIRIIYFCKFSHTAHRWFESLMLFVALACYLIGNLTGTYGWQGWVMPAPILVLALFVTLAVLRDQKQLLTYTKNGYKVNIGKPATDFVLPDQNGEVVRLSHYKSNRHILLIFVRGDWCPHCHMMLRRYEQNRHKFIEKDVMVLAVGPDPIGVNREMVEKLGLEYKILSDHKQHIATLYGVKLSEYDNPLASEYETEGLPLPASFLIDKKGVVRYISRPDRVGEFLKPELIFPVLETLN